MYLDSKMSDKSSGCPHKRYNRNVPEPNVIGLIKHFHLYIPANIISCLSSLRYLQCHYQCPVIVIGNCHDNSHNVICHKCLSNQSRCDRPHMRSIITVANNVNGTIVSLEIIIQGIL